MTARLKYRWLAVGLVWGLVLILTGWNFHRIDRIQMDRQHLETMQMDLRFLKANQPTIQSVRLEKSQLTHLVTSDDLGFLVVESNLKRLSWNFGLHKLIVKTDMDTSSSNMLPVTADAQGTVPAVVGWISAVEEAYPYLVIRSMDLVYEPATRAAHLQAVFDYHFTLSETDPVS